MIVELEAGSDPVQGTIGDPEGSGTPFSGYVGLIAALEGYRDHAGESDGYDGYRGERANAGSSANPRETPAEGEAVTRGRFALPSRTEAGT